MNNVPVVTSIHYLVIPQQGLFSVLVKIILAGENTAPITFETAPETSRKTAYAQALHETLEFIRDRWSELEEIVSKDLEASQAPPATSAPHPRV